MSTLSLHAQVPQFVLISPGEAVYMRKKSLKDSCRVCSVFLSYRFTTLTILILNNSQLMRRPMWKKYRSTTIKLTIMVLYHRNKTLKNLIIYKQSYSSKLFFFVLFIDINIKIDNIVVLKFCAGFFTL